MTGIWEEVDVIALTLARRNQQRNRDVVHLTQRVS